MLKKFYNEGKREKKLNGNDFQNVLKQHKTTKNLFTTKSIKQKLIVFGKDYFDSDNLRLLKEINRGKNLLTKNL